MALQTHKDYRVIDEGNTVRFLMPRRPLPVAHLIFLFLRTSLFLIWTTFFLYVVGKSALLSFHASSHQPATNWMVPAGMLVGVLLYSYFLFVDNVRKLGHLEVRLSKAEIQTGPSLGPIRLRRSRQMKSLDRLTVEGPFGNLSPDNEGPASLMAYFTDQKPLIVAKLFPRLMMDRLAADMVRAAARLGSGHKVERSQTGASFALSAGSDSHSAPSVQTLSDLEISQSKDRLMIRSRKLAVVLSLIFVLVLVPFSVGLSIKNIYPSAEAPAIWQRPASDRPMVIGFIIVLLVFFGLLPISFFLMRLRRRLRPWVFDRASGQLTHGNRSWPLADATAVAVDITTQKATVILRVGDDQAVEIVRFYSGPKGPSLASRIPIADAIANAISAFLHIPVSK